MYRRSQLRDGCLTRAHDLPGTNCERRILVHLSQNISNIGIRKSDRCRYSRRQNPRWKRPERKGRERRINKRVRGRKKKGRSELPFISVTREGRARVPFFAGAVFLCFCGASRNRGWQKFDKRNKAPVTSATVLASESFCRVIYLSDKNPSFLPLF